MVGSGSPLRILTEAKDLLSGAKRASMDSESEGSLGGSKAASRHGLKHHATRCEIWNEASLPLRSEQSGYE